MVRVSKKNDITDVSGLLAGQFTDREALCGVTVVLCPEGAVGGVDVRGSAPGTRETDLLHPVNLVEKIQPAADCLSRAIIHGILAAESPAGMTAFRDLELG